MCFDLFQYSLNIAQNLCLNTLMFISNSRGTSSYSSSSRSIVNSSSLSLVAVIIIAVVGVVLGVEAA